MLDDWKKYDVSELNDYAEIYSKKEAEDLKKSLEEHGFLKEFPIVIWENKIIDGWHRYAFSKDLNITPFFIEKEFKDEVEARKYIKLTNKRREMTPDQKSAFEVLSEKTDNLATEKAKIRMEKTRKELYQEKTDQQLKEEMDEIEEVKPKKSKKKKGDGWKDQEELCRKVVQGEMTEKEAQDVVSRQNLFSEKKKYEERIKQENKSDMFIDIFTTNKKFKVIYADPPWEYPNKQDCPHLGGALKHYSTMNIKDICKLPVPFISQKDSVLFLWATSPLIKYGFEVLESWGFEYKAMFIWDKVGHNMGQYNSIRHEILLIGGKGSSLPDKPDKKLYDSVQEIEKSKTHSEKPEEFREIIDNLYTVGDRIELFARNKKIENWYTWGDEA